MRHFRFIKAIYDIANVKVDEDRILAVYNLAKRAAEDNEVIQFTFASITWSVRNCGYFMEVSLITKDIIYSIYDNEEFKEPYIELNFNKGTKE